MSKLFLTPCEKHPEFAFLSILSISIYVNKNGNSGRSQRYSDNINHTCRVLLEWYFHFQIFQTTQQFTPSLKQFAMLTCCSKKAQSWQNSLSLLLLIDWVNGSDKLVHSNLIHRVKWIIALAWWLTSTSANIFI